MAVPDAAIEALRAQGCGALALKLVDGPVKAYPVEFLTANELPNEDFLLAALHQGGRTLVQEKVAMTQETRFFVVDDAVVTGSECVLEWTPLARAGLPVGDGIATRANVELAARMNVAARAFAIALSSHAPKFSPNYVIDLYYDPARDVVGVVELNPILASGRYASDDEAITRALVAWSLRQKAATPQSAAVIEETDL